MAARPTDPKATCEDKARMRGIARLCLRVGAAPRRRDARSCAWRTLSSTLCGLWCVAQNRERSMTVRPRRSVLYMPGLNERALEKAKTLPADALILDLEDSVAPESKIAARDNVCEPVKAGGYGRRELVIRVNAIETAWGMDDLRAAASVEPDAILVPKVATP